MSDPAERPLYDLRTLLLRLPPFVAAMTMQERLDLLGGCRALLSALCPPPAEDSAVKPGHYFPSAAEEAEILADVGRMRGAKRLSPQQRLWLLNWTQWLLEEAVAWRGAFQLSESLYREYAEGEGRDDGNATAEEG
jgi:hypothetical protein